MAGDWIKLRTHLKRDPKTVLMANFLAYEPRFVSWLTDHAQRSCESAYEHVTSNVTQALCVTGLLQVWGIAREQGHRQGDDLVLRPCNLFAISEIAEIPMFGEAMALVGWAVDDEANAQVVFPQYFVEKETPEMRHKTANAIRQERYRSRNKSVTSNVTQGVTRNVTDNVTVTQKVTERREEKSIKDIYVAEPQHDHIGGIDRILNAYPIQVAKEQARRSIALAINKLQERGQANPHQWLFDRVTAYANSRIGRSGSKFIPNPSKWFDRGSYDDDPAAWDRADKNGAAKFEEQIEIKEFQP